MDEPELKIAEEQLLAEARPGPVGFARVLGDLAGLPFIDLRHGCCHNKPQFLSIYLQDLSYYSVNLAGRGTRSQNSGTQRIPDGCRGVARRTALANWPYRTGSRGVRQPDPDDGAAAEHVVVRLLAPPGSGTDPAQHGRYPRHQGLDGARLRDVVVSAER